MPQMMPMMWIVFPIVVVVINLIVMMVNDENKMKIESELFVSLEMGNFKW